MGHAPPGVLRYDRIRHHPSPRTAALPHPVFVAQAAAFARAHCTQFRFKPRLVEGMHALHPNVQTRTRLRDADNGLPPPRSPQPVRDQVPVPKAFLRSFQRQRVSIPIFTARPTLFLRHSYSFPQLVQAAPPALSESYGRRRPVSRFIGSGQRSITEELPCRASATAFCSASTAWVEAK